MAGSPRPGQLEKEQFRQFHEHTLPYRFLPATADELAIVVAAFPPLTFCGGKGAFTLDHEKMGYDEWPEPFRFADIDRMTLDGGAKLTIVSRTAIKPSRSVYVSAFADRQQLLAAVNRYYGRYRAAVEFQKNRRAAAGG